MGGMELVSAVVLAVDLEAASEADSEVVSGQDRVVASNPASTAAGNRLGGPARRSPEFWLMLAGVQPIC